MSENIPERVAECGHVSVSEKPLKGLKVRRIQEYYRDASSDLFFQKSVFIDMEEKWGGGAGRPVGRELSKQKWDMIVVWNKFKMAAIERWVDFGINWLILCMAYGVNKKRG